MHWSLFPHTSTSDCSLTAGSVVGLLSGQYEQVLLLHTVPAYKLSRTMCFKGAVVCQVGHQG